MTASDQDDYDSPWKEALERYLPDFLALLFPQAHAGIDWSQGYEFLDKELQQVVRDAQLGRRLADKLVRVVDTAGQEDWLLIHLEVQGDPDAALAERLFVYNYRIFDRHRRPVISLAVLADERADWRPGQFGWRRWGCAVGIRFPSVKLLDYRARWAELEASANPLRRGRAGAPQDPRDTQRAASALSGQAGLGQEPLPAGLGARRHPGAVSLHRLDAASA
jgi:hypothetical protein